MKKRIIKKVNHQVVEDTEYNSTVNLSYIDRPAYVSAELGDHRRIFDLAYTGSTEPPVTVSIPSIGDVSVGVNSGRVIKAVINVGINLNEAERNKFINLTEVSHTFRSS